MGDAEILEGLAEKGFGHEQLQEMQKIINAKKSELAHSSRDTGGIA
jgi:hypothetical protein